MAQDHPQEKDDEVSNGRLENSQAIASEMAKALQELSKYVSLELYGGVT